MSLPTREIIEILKARHFYPASPLISEDGGSLKRTLEIIEICVEALPEMSRNIVKLHFFDRVPIAILTTQYNFTRQAVYKRINESVKKMVQISFKTGTG